jgi:type II secretory pathway component PulF
VSRQRKVWLAAALIGVPAVVYISVNEILHRFGMDIPWVQTYFEREIPFINSWIILAVLIIIIALSWFIKWFIRFRSIKNLQAG